MSLFPNPAAKNTFIFYTSLGILVITSAFCLSSWMKKNNPIYDQSFYHIGSHPEIVKEIGTPLFRNSRLTGGEAFDYANFDYIIRGPNGNANVKVVGKKVEENWIIDELVVTIGHHTYLLFEDCAQLYVDELSVDEKNASANLPIDYPLPVKEKPIIVINNRKKDGKEVLNTGTAITMDTSPWYYKVGIIAILGVAVGLVSAKSIVKFQRVKFQTSSLVKNAFKNVLDNKKVIDNLGNPLKLKGRSDGVLKPEYGKLTQLIEGSKGVGEIHLQALNYKGQWKITDLYVHINGKSNIKIDIKDDFEL